MQLPVALRRFLIALAICAPINFVWSAAAPNTAINDAAFEANVEAAAAELVAEGKLITLDALIASLPETREGLDLPGAGSSRLDPPEIAERLRAATLAVGYVFFCVDCDAWHCHLSTGFVVAPGGVICTSFHVFQIEDADAGKSYPVAVDTGGNVYPIVRMLAADVDADTCLVQAAGADQLIPLALGPQPRVGERVFLMSHPDTRYFRFTEGIVARWVSEPLEDGTELRLLDVTAEFAPGSSGGPVVDSYANVVGHVSTISATPLDVDGKPDDGSAIVERLCIASAHIRKLCIRSAAVD